MPWLRLYQLYSDGHLFAAGGASDQPAIYIEVMRVMAAAVNEVRSNAGRESKI